MFEILSVGERCQNSDLVARLAQISVTIAATEELLTAFPVPQKPALKMSDLLAGPILSDPFDPPNPPLPCLQVCIL